MHKVLPLLLAGWCPGLLLIEIASAETNTNTNPLALPDRGAVIGFSPTGEGYEFAQPPGRFADGAIGGGAPWRGYSMYQPQWPNTNDYIIGTTIVDVSHLLEGIEDYGIRPVPDLSEYVDKNSLWDFIETNPQTETPVVFATTSQGRTTLIPDVRLEKGVERLLLQASYKASGSWQTSSSSEGFMLAIRAGEPIEVRYTVPPDHPMAVVSSFEVPVSGESVLLPRGVHFFGVLAAYYYFPPWPSPENYNPPSGAEDSIALAISLVPVEVKGASRSDGKFTFEWSDRANRAVHVQRATSLSSGIWHTVGHNNSSKSFTDTNPPSGAAFYRVLVP